MKWWDWMPWSSFSECWALSQLFQSPLSLSSTGFWNRVDHWKKTPKSETCDRYSYRVSTWIKCQVLISWCFCCVLWRSGRSQKLRDCMEASVSAGMYFGNKEAKCLPFTSMHHLSESLPSLPLFPPSFLPFLCSFLWKILTSTKIPIDFKRMKTALWSSQNVTLGRREIHIWWMKEWMNEPICMKGNDPFCWRCPGWPGKGLKETMRCQSKLEMKC